MQRPYFSGPANTELASMRNIAQHEQIYFILFFFTKTLFSSNFFYKINTVVFSYVFNKYCLNINVSQNYRQTVQLINFFLYLIFYICIARFDATRNLQNFVKFLELKRVKQLRAWDTAYANTRAASTRPWAFPDSVDASHGGATVLHRFAGSATPPPPAPPRLRPPLRLDVRDTRPPASSPISVSLGRRRDPVSVCSDAPSLPQLRRVDGPRRPSPLRRPRNVSASTPAFRGCCWVSSEFLLFPNFTSLSSRSYLPCRFSGSVRWRWRARWWTLRRPR